MIVDAHAHVFEAIQGTTRAGPTRSGLRGMVVIGGRDEQVLPASFERSSFPTELLLSQLDMAGVTRAVLLQGPFFGEENAYVAEACRSQPQRLTGQAYLDPWSDNARAAFRIIKGLAEFPGVKLECTEPTGLLGLHPGRRLDEPDLEWLWKELDRIRGVLTLDLGRPGTPSYQSDAVRRIAVEHPGLRIVICHLGQPAAGVLRDPDLRRAWEGQMSLGRLANVWFDTAALPAYHPGEKYPWPGATESLRSAVDLVGPGKLLWGSDTPMLLVYESYPRLLAYVQEGLAFLPSADRDRVFGGNAMEAYSFTGIRPPGGTRPRS